MHYLSERDELLEEALPLHAQRWGLEVLLRRALVRAPVMSEEEVNARSRQEPSRLAHERPVHMGKKVHEYRKKHGHDYGKTGSGEETPIFTADGIKDWLREDMINPDTGEPYSRATVLKDAQKPGAGLTRSRAARRAWRRAWITWKTTTSNTVRNQKIRPDNT